MLEDTAIIESKYQLFINRVAATKLVWALKSKEGWANSNSNDSEDVIVVPSISTEDAIKRFPKGVREVKPYLRYTPVPEGDKK